MEAFKNEYSGVGTTGLRRPRNMSGEELIQWILDNKAHIDSNSGCWIWDGTVNNKGRPQIYHEGKNHLISRLSWEIYNEKPIPKGLQAGHTCEHKSPDHKRCFNPHHIKPMTQSENETMKPENSSEKFKEKQRQIQLNRIATKTPRMPAGITHKERVEWLFDNVYEEDENGCWIYQGPISKDGYGRRSINFKQAEGSQSVATTSGINAGRKKVEIHRYIYFILNDLDYCNPPKGMVVHHTCGNRVCGKPDHLELGTKSENSRATRSYNANTKLTEEDVKCVCYAWLNEREDHPNNKAFYEAWALEFGVSGLTIYNIVCRRKNWQDIATPILGEII